MADRLPIYRYLDTDGDGTGTKNAKGNYASATDFYIQAPAGTRMNLHRMIVFIEDTTGIKPELYGSNAALTNGITVKLTDSSNNVILDLTDGVPIKTNAQWGGLCHDVVAQQWGNTPTDEAVTVRWTFSRAGKPLILEDGQKLKVILNDNLTGLVNHYFMVQGYYETRGY